jgi:hypothetical protein
MKQVASNREKVFEPQGSGRITGSSARANHQVARGPPMFSSVCLQFSSLWQKLISMLSSQKWLSFAWALLGVSMALLFAKDVQVLRDHPVSSGPLLVSLVTGFALATSGLAQSQRHVRMVSHAVAVACVLYAVSNLVMVMRLASIWSLASVALAALGLALSIFNLRFSTQVPPKEAP